MFLFVLYEKENRPTRSDPKVDWFVHHGFSVKVVNIEETSSDAESGSPEGGTLTHYYSCSVVNPTGRS